MGTINMSDWAVERWDPLTAQPLILMVPVPNSSNSEAPNEIMGQFDIDSLIINISMI